MTSSLWIHSHATKMENQTNLESFSFSVAAETRLTSRVPFLMNELENVTHQHYTPLMFFICSFTSALVSWELLIGLFYMTMYSTRDKLQTNIAPQGRWRHWTLTCQGYSVLSVNFYLFFVSYKNIYPWLSKNEKQNLWYWANLWR